MNDWSNELLAAPAYSPADAGAFLSVGYNDADVLIVERMTRRRYYPALIKLSYS